MTLLRMTTPLASDGHADDTPRTARHHLYETTEVAGDNELSVIRSGTISREFSSLASDQHSDDTQSST